MIAARLYIQCWQALYSDCPNSPFLVVGKRAHHINALCWQGWVEQLQIFKPELRYIAARLVFERLITPLAEGARRVDISIGPDTEFGTLATVTIDGPISEAQSIAVKDALSRFQLRSQIVINQ